jgi:hypothetical protein
MPYETQTEQYRGVVVHLRKSAQGWSFGGDEEDIWSDCGSASGTIFPPYPNKGDYRPATK